MLKLMGETDNCYGLLWNIIQNSAIAAGEENSQSCIRAW